MSSVKDTSAYLTLKSYGGMAVQSGNGDPPLTLIGETRKLKRTRTGVRLPHYREIIAAGKDATTPMTAEYEHMSFTRDTQRVVLQYTPNPTMFAVYLNKGDTIAKSDNYGPSDYLLNQQTSSASVENAASAAWYKAVRAQDRKFNGLIFLGELGETLHMLRHPTTTLHNLARDFAGTLRKRKRANPKGWMKDVGSLWLEQSFGWKPAINDAKDAVKAYHELLNRQRSVAVSAGAQKSYDFSSSLPGTLRAGVKVPYIGGVRMFRTYGLLREKHTVRYRGRIDAQVDAPVWNNLDLFGFSAKEFVPTLWELLPWSFLVDYFTNVGDILDANVLVGRKLAFADHVFVCDVAYHGYLATSTTLTDYQTNGFWRWITSSGSPLQLHSSRKTVTRSPSVEVPFPHLEFTFSLSDNQLGNIAALLTQVGTDLHPQSAPHRWHR